MYNESQKLRYIDTLTESSSIKANAAFKSVTPFEEKINTDCSCFTAQEIMACLKQMNSPSINTIRNIKSSLSSYADWCKMQNLLPDGINHYKDVVPANLFECLSDRILSEGYLTEADIANLVAELENTFEKVAVLLAYEGFLFANYYDAYMIGTDDIDGNVLNVGSQVGEASPELRLYIEEAEGADVYYQRMPDGDVRELKFQDGGGPVFKQLYNTVRSYDTLDQRRHYFERLFRRIREYTGERFITIKKINESGRINAIKSFMKAEGATDARKVFMAHKRELDLKYGEILEVGRFFNQHKSIFATD